jgi:hypothetical protein
VVWPPLHIRRSAAASFLPQSSLPGCLSLAVDLVAQQDI